MAGSLWLLAMFGYIHGVSEWAYFYVPYRASVVSSEWAFRLDILEVTLIGISFVFLLFFGIRLLSDVVKSSYFKYIFSFSIFLAMFWISYFIIYRLIIVGENIPQWLTLADIYSRYFFGLPGGLFSAYAIYRQKDQVRLLGGKSILYSINILTWSFFGYALFAGLIVPSAPFFPASVFNTENLFAWTTIPTALFRTFFSLCITGSMLNFLALFQIEKAEFINRVISENAVLMERERIKRDLHDGIIQSLYALGLQMKDGECFLEEGRFDEAKIRVASSIDNVDHIIRDLRVYIQDLKSAELAGLSLDQILNNLVKYCERFNIRIVLDSSVQSKIDMSTETKIHLYHILQELVTNVIKHADASEIKLSLITKNEHVVVEVEDDGLGFDTRILDQIQEAQEKRGLYNVQARIKSMQGCFEIKSVVGTGTKIILGLPQGRENNEYQKNIDSR